MHEILVGGASPAHQSVTTATSQLSKLQVSTKLDARYVPKLKAGVSLKGKIFDKWLIAFKVKLEQAGRMEIIDSGYVPPSPHAADYDFFEMKAAFLASHLITATVHSNAYSFSMDASKQNGHEMYKSLLEIYCGQHHDRDDAASVTTDLNGLVFGPRSLVSAETFMARFTALLKRMETTNAHGNRVPAMRRHSTYDVQIQDYPSSI